jgi:hypothetical protein
VVIPHDNPELTIFRLVRRRRGDIIERRRYCWALPSFVRQYADETAHTVSRRPVDGIYQHLDQPLCEAVFLARCRSGSCDHEGVGRMKIGHHDCVDGEHTPVAAAA